MTKREKVTIAIVSVIVLVLFGLAVHKTDRYNERRRNEARIAAQKRDAANELSARKAVIKAEQVRVHDTCISSQVAYDKQTPAQVKLNKSARPVCAPLTK